VIRLARLALVATLASCAATATAGAPPPKSAKVKSMTTPPTDVKTLLALRDLSRKQVLEALAPAQVDEHRAYEKLKDVTVLSNKEKFPGWFYFRGDQLVMVYIGRGEYLGKLDPKGIEAELGTAPTKLRSRSGRDSSQAVFADKGFAFSFEKGEGFDFVEVFPPTTHEKYLATIYEEVTPFIK
jgi:hypothetical protein